MNDLRVLPYASLSLGDAARFYLFCEQLGTRSEPAAKNMAEVPALLGTRFGGSRGEMYVVFDGARVVGCSGCYVSEFSDKVGLLGVRSWLEPEYRSRQIIRNRGLPAQRDWMISKGMKQVALSFNEYNRKLVYLFTKGFVKREHRTPRHMFYLNMHVLSYQVVIQHTPQWVIYEKLDPTSAWDFDWFTLAYRGDGCLEYDLE